MKIRIAGIIAESIVDGPGIRFVVFTQGCPHHCEGCHNPDTHAFNGGFIEDTDNIVEQIKKHPFMSGLTISGGEPFVQPKEILDLILKFKQVYSKKTIMIYTGFTYEELVKMNNIEINQILKEATYLVDGKYLKEKRDISLKYRGSTNQRILDLQNTTIDLIKKVEF